MAEAPLFCLGGVIYQWNPDVVWDHDRDALLDAVRETYAAVRNHHWATLTPDRDWLDCECADPATHRDSLLVGLNHVISVMTSLPHPYHTVERKAPVLWSLARFVQSLVIAGSLGMLVLF